MGGNRPTINLYTLYLLFPIFYWDRITKITKKNLEFMILKKSLIVDYYFK